MNIHSWISSPENQQVNSNFNIHWIFKPSYSLLNCFPNPSLSLPVIQNQHLINVIIRGSCSFWATKRRKIFLVFWVAWKLIRQFKQTGGKNIWHEKVYIRWAEIFARMGVRWSQQQQTGSTILSSTEELFACPAQAFRCSLAP